MRLRLAKTTDHKAIANIHYAARKELSAGFFASVSKIFLLAYYKVTLNDPNYLVLCAEDDEGYICGFVSASLDASKHFKNLSKHRLLLVLSMVPSFFLNPKLLSEALKRYRAVSQTSDEKFVTLEGPRGEYWVWDDRKRNPAWAIKLYRAHLELLRVLGVERLYFEVDVANVKVSSFHKINGADLIERYILADGRCREAMYYDLSKFVSGAKSP